MKRKLLLALAVVFGMTAMFAQKPVDLSAKYLKNYTDPYEYVNKFTAEGDTIIDNAPEDAMSLANTTNITIAGENHAFYRFRKLGAPWVVENMINEEDGTFTGWHVDLNKGKSGAIRGALTLTSGWDGFVAEINNAKVFQTVTLPAGKYTLNAHYGQDVTGTKYGFLVVNKGTSIPDTTDVANAIAYKKLLGLASGKPISVEFELAAETEVSLGVVASLPGDGSNTCIALGDIRLGGFVEGTNYTLLKQLVATANTMQEASYPLGVTGGKYLKEKWDAFVTARAAADTIARHENMEDPTMEGFKDNHTQAEVDAALTALQTAINDLNASFIIPFKVSTDTEERYYLIHDRRIPSRYWTVAEAEYDGAYKWRGSYGSEVDKTAEINHFKFVKNPDGNGYFIVSRSTGAKMSVGTAVGNFLMFDTEVSGVPFNIKAAVGGHADYYRIFSQSNNQELNTFQGATSGILGFYTTTGEDQGSDFYFERVYAEGEINMTAIKNEYAKLAVASAEQFPQGTGPGQFPQEKWDAFVTARTAAKAIIDTEDTPEAPADQVTVDTATETMVTAFNELNAAMIPPMKFSTDAEEVWYFMEDKRISPYMWTYDSLEGRIKVVKKEEADYLNDESYQFKFVKPADAVGNEFFIYSKVSPAFPVTYIADDSDILIFAGFDESSDSIKFVSGKTPAFDAEYFTIGISGQPAKQLNSHHSAGVLGFYNPVSTDDPGNDWKFIPVIGAGVKNASVQDLGIMVRQRRILSTEANAEINVFNISGQRISADKDLVPGVYVVTVKGKAGAAKVVVR